MCIILKLLVDVIMGVLTGVGIDWVKYDSLHTEEGTCRNAFV